MLKVERSKSVACVRVQRCQKKKSVFSGTLSFIENKCAEIWKVEPTSKVLLWTLTLSADLPKSLWCSAVGLDQDFAFSYQTMESSLKHLPVLIIHKSRICPFHTFDLWIYLLLLMCGHSKRFNHDLMHISEAWAGFLQ